MSIFELEKDQIVQLPKTSFIAEGVKERKGKERSTKNSQVANRYSGPRFARDRGRVREMGRESPSHRSARP